ncbi:MAG: hypothetical protein HY820_22005 [Acidobacteria bacterium]|nr:hypothetical protein [Acidobacteriota bacterium]
MNNWRRMGRAVPQEHATDDQLIQVLDGELPRPVRDTVTAHVEACWNCRRRQEQLLRTMECFTELEEIFVSQRESLPPRDWADFPARLRLASATLPQRRVTSAARGAVVVLGTTLVALSLAVLVYPTPTLSAKEVLKRAGRWEKTASSTVAHPVVRQRIRIRSGQRQADGAVLRSEETRAFLWRWEQAPDAELRREVESVYASAALDFGRPISAANHAGWSARMGARVDDVETSGEFLRVRSYSQETLAPGAVVETELLVRAGDGHPVEQSFTVATGQNRRRYQLMETGFEVSPMTEETARLLTPPSLPEGSVTRASVALQPELPTLASEPSESLVPSSALPDLAEVEIETLAAVMESGADVTDAAIVRRNDHGVEVVAYAAEAERKTFLEQHLATNANVKVTVHLLSGLAPQVSGATTIAGITPARFAAPLFLNEWTAATGSAAIATRIVSYQLDNLRRMKLELAAIADLNRRFPPALRRALATPAQQRLDAMGEQHLSSARRYWAAFEATSGPLLAVVGVPVSRDQSPDSRVCDWAGATGLASTARRMDDLFSRAFTTVAFTTVAGGEDTLSAISGESLRGQLSTVHSQLAAALATTVRSESCRP